MDKDKLIAQLPYAKPFLFVDSIAAINEEGVTGNYTFREDEYFYEGHFKGNPVTPGVILIECMAQIGLVCLGVFISNQKERETASVAFSNSEVDFLLPVYPGELITVVSEKQYFRFGKLKCKVKMFNSEDALVCKGVLSGMIVTTE